MNEFQEKEEMTLIKSRRRRCQMRRSFCGVACKEPCRSGDRRSSRKGSVLCGLLHVLLQSRPPSCCTPLSSVSHPPPPTMISEDGPPDDSDVDSAPMRPSDVARTPPRKLKPQRKSGACLSLTAVRPPTRELTCAILLAFARQQIYLKRTGTMILAPTSRLGRIGYARVSEARKA